MLADKRQEMNERFLAKGEAAVTLTAPLELDSSCQTPEINSLFVFVSLTAGQCRD